MLKSLKGLAFQALFLIFNVNKKVMKRGRPAEIKSEEPPRKFVRTYKYSDGIRTEWTYDLDKYPNGPIKVEVFYPKNYDDMEEEELPKSKRKYLNPYNGKKVAYARARALGIID